MELNKLQSYLLQKEQMLMQENKEEINGLHFSMLLDIDIKKLQSSLLQKEQMLMQENKEEINGLHSYLH